MSSGRFDYSVAIGGAAGQGIATPGNILPRMQDLLVKPS